MAQKYVKPYVRDLDTQMNIAKGKTCKDGSVADYTGDVPCHPGLVATGDNCKPGNNVEGCRSGNVVLDYCTSGVGAG